MAHSSHSSLILRHKKAKGFGELLKNDVCVYIVFGGERPISPQFGSCQRNCSTPLSYAQGEPKRVSITVMPNRGIFWNL